jgi:hypothetical protein
MNTPDSPGPPARTRPPLFLTGLAATMWLLLAGLLAAMTPRYEQIFTDFGVQLPGLTVAFLNSVRWLTGERPGQSFPGWPLLAAAVLVLCLAGAALASRPSTRGAGLGLLMLLILGAVAGVFVTLVSLALPMPGLIESLQKSAPAPAPAVAPAPGASGAPATPASR